MEPIDDSDLVKRLNPEQLKAVRHERGALMVLAGAGAGKTAVMTRRAARLVRLGHNPERIMVVTFTNKAARELRDRCVSLLGVRGKRMAAGTFHSLMLRHILRPAEEMGLLRDFGIERRLSVLDAADSSALWRAAWKEVCGLHKRDLEQSGLDLKKAKSTIGLLAARGIGATPKHERPDDGKQGISPAQTEAERLIRLAFSHKCAGDIDVIANFMRRLWEGYHDACRSLNAIDFDDILTLSARLLRDRADFADGRGGLFSHVLVDEYQDTNGVQNEIVDRLVKAHGNLAVCGDDRQAIYGFRGSDVSIIRGFQERYPRADIVDLVRNYRSGTDIVVAANACARAMPDRLSNSDMLAEGIHAGQSPTPVCHHYLDDDQEADGLSQRLSAARRNGMPWGNMAVLYRTRSIKNKFEHALVRGHIPYVVVGDLGFFEHRDTADMMGLIRVLANKDDSLGWRRLLKAGGFGVSDKMLSGRLSSGQSAWEALCDIVRKRKEKALRLRSLMTQAMRFEEQAHKPLPDVSELVRGVVLAEEPVQDFQGYLLSLWDHYLWPHLRADKETEYAKRYSANRNGASRRQKLLTEYRDQCFDRVSTIVSWVMQTRAECATWGETIDELMLQADADCDDSDVVRLMTVHASKGLEFEQVWYLGGGDMDPRDAQTAGLDEERRIFYVAITRSKRVLEITQCDNRYLYGQAVDRAESHFIHEISHTVDHISAVPDTAYTPRQSARSADYAE